MRDRWWLTSKKVKNSRLEARCTTDERKACERNAEKLGMRLADYVVAASSAPSDISDRIALMETKTTLKRVFFKP